MSDSEIKWEYHLEMVYQLKKKIPNSLDVEADPRLKHLGEEGWELVGFHDADAFFKRRMASKDDAQSLFEE